ncbi:MAG TPA: hypothetical protein VIT92_00540, partial [Burkholderiaceae bacterium]
PIHRELSAFSNVNEAVNERLHQLLPKTNPECEGVLSAMARTALDGAGLAYVAWAAIVADLRVLVDLEQPLAHPCLQHPALSSAIAAWTGLAQDAGTFAELAASELPKRYMSGAWITDTTPADKVFLQSVRPLDILGQYLILCAGYPPPYPMPPFRLHHPKA